MLIGLAGNMGSGKSTCASYLVNQGFIERTFADPLKQICQILFELNTEQLYGSQAEKNEPDPRWYMCSPRTMMQFIGTDVLRKQLETIMPGIGDDFFVINAKNWYEQYIKVHPGANIVISDVRFENEADFIKKAGGIIILIDRCVDVNSHSSHSSEAGIRNSDIIIDNNSSLDKLYQKLDKIISKIR